MLTRESKDIQCSEKRKSNRSQATLANIAPRLVVPITRRPRTFLRTRLRAEARRRESEKQDFSEEACFQRRDRHARSTVNCGSFGMLYQAATRGQENPGNRTLHPKGQLGRPQVLASLLYSILQGI